MLLPWGLQQVTNIELWSAYSYTFEVPGENMTRRRIITYIRGWLLTVRSIRAHIYGFSLTQYDVNPFWVPRLPLFPASEASFHLAYTCHVIRRLYLIGWCPYRKETCCFIDCRHAMIRNAMQCNKDIISSDVKSNFLHARSTALRSGWRSSLIRWICPSE